jgi:hypothetical protein
MSFNSKKTITSIIAGILLVIAYISFSLGIHAPERDDLRAWAVAMLVFMGMGVAFLIVIQLIFHIAAATRITAEENKRGNKETGRTLSSLMVEDERDKLISLKSSNIGYIFAGVGFVAVLLGLAFGLSAVFALHILFASFAVGSIAEGILTVYLYEKGVRNG